MVRSEGVKQLEEAYWKFQMPWKCLPVPETLRCVQSSVKAQRTWYPSILPISPTLFLPVGDRIRSGSHTCPEFHSMTENGKSQSFLGSKQCDSHGEP